MTTSFYNKVADKFGSYHTGARCTKEYPNGEPEEVFKEKLLELSGKDKVALDVGCADGRFTLSVASSFQKIIAIDLSTGMLEAAKRNKKDQGIDNVSFEEQDASKTNFTDSKFDIIYSRRGPTLFQEFHRLLKLGGYFVGINIGEKDCVEIKKISGRGQGFGEWNSSRLEADKHRLEKEGFEVIFAQDYSYDEYFASLEDLDLFLQGVPIFEDYDSEKDRKYIEEYVAKFKTDKGIRFPRHRVVNAAQKI